jgi:Flp pilus assembly protein TadG
MRDDQNGNSRARKGWRSFRGDRRGVAAIEFAFIAPLLLVMYFVTMEVAQGIDSNKKVGRVASIVGDLLTQQQTLTQENIKEIMQIGEATLQPYNRTRPKITATAIEVTNEDPPKVKVVWSRRYHDGAFTQVDAPGTITTVPEKLKIKGSFLIRVQNELDYRPVITWTATQKKATGLTAAFDSIDMKEVYYLRPRMSQSVTCSNC